MQRYYQGQLDFFCAIYAVINALTALYGINLAQSRALLASILGDLSTYPELWRTTLENRTDFHWLTAHMLYACGKGISCPVQTFRPFAVQREIPESAANLDHAQAYCDEEYAGLVRGTLAPQIWAAFEDWLPETREQPRAGCAKRVVILRFHRYMQFLDTPIVSHWSVVDHYHKGVFHLRDASKDEGALYSLDKNVTVFAPELVSGDWNVRVEPESVYFIERR